jgi:DNA polymerase
MCAYLKQKLQQLHWLKVMNIDYYCSDNRPLIKPLFANDLKETMNVKTTFKYEDHDDALKQARFLADSARNIQELKASLLSFNKCNLKDLANNMVFADGIESAKIMLIGEAPGVHEDATSIPFCGISGQLLDNMLQSINISRKNNAYITNIIFWRPPANRRPTQHEIDICRPFVEKHIALINPKLIILVGNTAIKGLLGTFNNISNMRQEYYSYSNQYLHNNITTTSIFHPAYLLRQPTQKKTTWYDLLRIEEFINSFDKLDA